MPAQTWRTKLHAAVSEHGVQQLGIQKTRSGFSLQHSCYGYVGTLLVCPRAQEFAVATELVAEMARLRSGLARERSAA